MAELARLTKQNEVEYVIIESTGISEPMQVAETFTAEFSTAMLEAEDQIGNDDADAKKILNEMYDAPHIAVPFAFEKLTVLP